VHVILQQLDVDIVCLIETWLNPAILLKLTDFTGYTTYQLDRSDGRQGGEIAVVVQNSYWATCVSHHQNLCGSCFDDHTCHDL